MRISGQGITELTEAADKKRDADIQDQRRSDRFSQLLKNDEKKKRDTVNEHDSEQDRRDIAEKIRTPLNASADALLPAGASGDFSRSNTSHGAAIEQNQGGPESSRTNPVPDRLAGEIGHQIEVLKLNGKAEAVNITFNSKTLDGLHVQVRQDRGEIAIRFVTQSQAVSKLLAQHTGQLREALVNKGVKIRNVSIANISGRTSEKAPGYVKT